MFRKGFSILEVLASVAVIGVLMALLLPTLHSARNAALRTACANNLKQVGFAWTLYVQDNRDILPGYTQRPEWNYGGVAFLGAERRAVLDVARPINRYLGVDEYRQPTGQPELTRLFSCPGDFGVRPAGLAPRELASAVSILPGGTCYREFGTSYRANQFLLDSTAAGIDDRARPLALHEIQVSTSRLLVLGDAAWYYASRDRGDPDFGRNANWHSPLESGNMLAVDGSVRFVPFGPGTTDVAQHPRKP